MDNNNIVFIIILSVLIFGIGVCKGICDLLQFHYGRGFTKNITNHQFWNPSISWKNKYKEDLKTPKFFGSTTFFVTFTDAWHTFQFISSMLICLFGSIIAYKFFNLNVSVFTFVLIKLFYQAGFKSFYR